MGALDIVAIDMAAENNVTVTFREITVGHSVANMPSAKPTLRPSRGRMRVFNMKIRSTLLMCGALFMLCSNFASQEAKAQSSAVSPLVDDPSPKPTQNPSEAKPMITNCYTNENNFAGQSAAFGYANLVE
jgi:hypothetical protein